MISKHILASLEEYLAESVRDNSVNLFAFGNETGLRAHAQSFKYFSAVIEHYQEYRQELLACSTMGELTSSEIMRVQLLLAQFDRLSVENSAGSSGHSDSEEEEEEKDSEVQDDSLSEDSDDEEGGLISSGGAKRLMASLSKDLSYIDDLKKLFLCLQERTALGQVTKISAEVSNRFMGMANRFKEFIRSVSEFLGIKGVLVAVARLMMMSKAIEVPVKVINTILVVSIFTVFIVVYPLYRFGKNPLRILKWLFEDLEIEVPEVE